MNLYANNHNFTHKCLKKVFDEKKGFWWKKTWCLHYPQCNSVQCPPAPISIQRRKIENPADCSAYYLGFLSPLTSGLYTLKLTFSSPGLWGCFFGPLHWNVAAVTSAETPRSLFSRSGPDNSETLWRRELICLLSPMARIVIKITRRRWWWRGRNILMVFTLLWVAA